MESLTLRVRLTRFAGRALPYGAEQRVVLSQERQRLAVGHRRSVSPRKRAQDNRTAADATALRCGAGLLARTARRMAEPVSRQTPHRGTSSAAACREAHCAFC
jgi:hypothetical protein